MRWRNLPLLLSSVGLLGVAGVALAAASWSDFKPAFPPLPCQDGWAACLVGGQAVTPGMVLDGQGRPHPADMRIGFFDFDGLPGLSPFSGLSAYPVGGEPRAGAKKPETVAQAPQVDAGAAEREAARRAAEAARAAEQAEAAARREAERVAASEARARQEQEAARKAAEAAAREAATARDATARAEAERRAQAARQAAEEAAKRAEAERQAAEAARKAQEAEAKRRAEAEAARVAAEEQARKAQEAAAAQAAQAEAARKAQEAAALAARTSVGNAGTEAVAMSSAPPASGGGGEAASCDNLVALEVPAMMGNLGAPVRSCLEKSLGSSASQTTRDKISRVLIADAEARRDQGEWERLMKRHLETIDRSDPNLCFKYALHLSRGGASRAPGVIRWADYALENKQQWEGATYTKNVYGLYKIRAQAANKIWEEAEKKAVEDRSEENEQKAERARGQTKDFAREWLDYARASAQDTAGALALCVSAAGNKEFCGG